MFRRITVGLKGGMLPVASAAERLLKLGGCKSFVLLSAFWLVLPLGGPGCKLADHAGESDWLALCDCQWPLALCQWASGFGGAWLRVSPSSESLGVVFLLVGVPAQCPVHLSVPAHCGTGSGSGGDQHGVEDPGILAFGGGGSGNGGGP